MPLFPLPTPSEILNDSSLRVEQLNPLYASGDALADLAQKIGEVAAVVENRLLSAAKPALWPFSDVLLKAAYPAYDDATRAAFTLRQQTVATLATKKLVLASVYERAGNLNKAYAEKAAKYEHDGMELLRTERKEGLLDAIEWIANETRDTNEGARSVLTSVPVSNDTDYFDEFSGYDWGYWGGYRPV